MSKECLNDYIDMKTFKMPKGFGCSNTQSEEHGDFFIRFMHPHGPSKLFHWPNKEDTCWVREGDIFCVIDTPSVASSRRMYGLSKKKNDATIARLWGKWLTVVW